MRARKPHLDEAQRQLVREWWSALQPDDAANERRARSAFGFDRGDRAALRRAVSVDDLLLTRASHVLAQRLVSLDERKTHRRLGDDVSSYQRLALAAGVLSHVKDDSKDGRSLAWALGEAAGNERALMSELRFKRLLNAVAPDDVYRQVLRAVALAKAKADVAQLADDILAWLAEAARPDSRPADSVRLHWAHDYYLSAKEQAGAAEPVSTRS